MGRDRALKTPELVIVDGAPGLGKALAALWSDKPVNVGPGHAPDALALVGLAARVSARNP
jgi:hypothetical protein